HYLMKCPAHANARPNLVQAAGRDARNIVKLLSMPALFPHLFWFIKQSGRFNNIEEAHANA
ncbi:hypothetical protein BYT27DRAFT_7115069, partial [Phlegmacium glaucopus]